MFDFSEIKNALYESFEDYKLDSEEKSSLLKIFQVLTEEQRSYARNQAFKIVRESLGDAPTPLALKWLERIIKTIDLSLPAVAETSSYFSPGNDCRDTIIDNIKRCSHSLDVCVFTISDNYIRDALLDVYKRGVAVRIISDNDKANDRGSDIDYLIESGVPVRIDRTSHHMHHKFAIFDDKTLLTGSFNWTRSATDNNHENILVTNDSNAMQQFKGEFEVLWSEFEP